MLAEWIGHLGGGLMLLFLALLALRCAGQLGILKKDPFAEGLRPLCGSGPHKKIEQPGEDRPRSGERTPGEAGEDGPAEGAHTDLCPLYRPGPAELLLAFFGVLAVQWGFAFLCWLSLHQPGGLAAFFAHFWQRFTTAGDSPHYLFLAQHGYVTQGENARLIVFYPLYPLLIRLTHALLAPFGAGWELSALLCSQLCWGAAGAAMLRLAGLSLGREQAACAVLLMALYPFGFFSLGVFTESLFLLLCLLSVYAAGTRHWPAAGLFCALAGLCRTQGLALLPALGFLWVRAEGKRLLSAVCPGWLQGYLQKRSGDRGENSKRVYSKAAGRGERPQQALFPERPAMGSALISARTKSAGRGERPLKGQAGGETPPPQLRSAQPGPLPPYPFEGLPTADLRYGCGPAGCGAPSPSLGSSPAAPGNLTQKAPPVLHALLGLVLMPLGWLGYLLLNAALFGDPFIFMQFQSAPPWYQSIRWIGPNLAQHWQMAQEYPGLAPFIYHSQLALYFVGMALLLWGIFAGRPVHWLVWGGGYTGMCYLSSWLISGSRYMFGCLPLFLLAACERRPVRLLLLLLSAGALYYFGTFYMQGQAIM